MFKLTPERIAEIKHRHALERGFTDQRHIDRGALLREVERLRNAWRPASEPPAEPGDYLAAVMANGRRVVHEIEWVLGGWAVVDWTVTHWQPLPAAPE